jgi:hypothetical protein
MRASDGNIMEWISTNWFLVSLAVPTALGILKGVAKIIPGVKDDKIVTMLEQAWNTINRKEKIK